MTTNKGQSARGTRGPGKLGLEVASGAALLRVHSRPRTDMCVQTHGAKALTVPSPSGISHFPLLPSGQFPFSF